MLNGGVVWDVHVRGAAVKVNACVLAELKRIIEDSEIMKCVCVGVLVSFKPRFPPPPPHVFL